MTTTPDLSKLAATLTISVEGSTTTIDCQWGDAIRGLPPGAYPLRFASPAPEETVRLAKVALAESEGARMVCNWMSAALKVCHAVVAQDAQSPVPAPEVPTGPQTEFVLNELRSALSAMLTFFGMDEDEASKPTFDKARQAENYAVLVMRPLKPWERQSLEDFRACVHRWHEKAVAKGYDGVEAMCDTAPGPSPAEGDALSIARDALEEIALAGMSGSGQESEDGMRAWHARQAWKFIGIAARALDGVKAAALATNVQPKGTPAEPYEYMPEHTPGDNETFERLHYFEEYCRGRGHANSKDMLVSHMWARFAASKAPAPAPDERDRLRAAQAAAVMPLIGPLLDAWENADHDVLEDQTELVKQMEAINTAMETAGDSDDWEALAFASPAVGAQVSRPCRTDGRCQYAIDVGAEGMGSCSPRCMMPPQAVADVWVRREYHEYENSAKEDHEGYLVRTARILDQDWARALPEGYHQLYAAPVSDVPVQPLGGA